MYRELNCADELEYAKVEDKEIILPEIDSEDYNSKHSASKLFTRDYKLTFLSPDCESIELMAPASASTYKLAIRAGANSIYIGYGEFNARAKIDNFTDLREVVEFSHFHGVKVYLALNIAVYEDELKKVTEIIKYAEEVGVDAFIISDLALYRIIKGITEAPIHLSTQAGIYNTWGMAFCYEFGLNRVVLAREDNIDDLKAIRLTTPYTELEVFVHGAICSGFSGACLFSSMLTGNSGNRGRCNQLCRKEYTYKFNGKETMKGYLLSAKDNCYAGQVYTLERLKIDSVKIEGRARRPEYVGGVTRYYRDKISRREILTEDHLKRIFNRGDFTEGYLYSKDVIYPALPNHIGVKLGKIVHIVDKNTAYVSVKEKLHTKSGYKIIRNQKDMGGAVSTGEMLENFGVIKTNFKLKLGDELRITNDYKLTEAILGQELREPVNLILQIVSNRKPRIDVDMLGRKFSFYPDIVIPEAINRPLYQEEVFDLFEKSHLREVKFTVNKLALYNAFLTKAQQNAIRRLVLDYVWHYVLSFYLRDFKTFFFREAKLCGALKEENIVYRKIHANFVEVDTIEKAKLVLHNFTYFVYSPSVYDEDELYEVAKFFKRKNKIVFLKVPNYVPANEQGIMLRSILPFHGVMLNNVNWALFARSTGKKILFGYNANITNMQNWFVENSNQVMVSTELSYERAKKFNKPIIYTYGKLPLMCLNFCPRRNAGRNCSNCKGDLTICDDKGEYYVRSYKVGNFCGHTMHNSVLTDIGNVKKDFYMYFDFTLSTPSEIKRTINNYKSSDYKPTNTNKLHLNRGAK